MNKDKLEVIATFGEHEQEGFQLPTPPEHALESEGLFIAFIFSQLENPITDLWKLSLCWTGQFKDIRENEVFRKSVEERNGKYFFKNGVWEG